MCKCFACDRKITKETPDVLVCEDEQKVYVGACYYKKALKSGTQGYQPPKGGPKLYTLENKRRVQS